jgi:hypothetical protein
MMHLETTTFSSVLSIEDRQAVCQSNDSLFVLVGNPGLIWHPKSQLDSVFTPNWIHIRRTAQTLDLNRVSNSNLVFYFSLSVGRFFLNKLDTR